MRTGVCALGLIASFAARAQSLQIVTNDIPETSLVYATLVPYTNAFQYTNVILYTTDSTLAEGWVSLETSVSADVTGTVEWFTDNYAPIGSNPVRYYRVVQIPPSNPVAPPSAGMIVITNGSFMMGDALDGAPDAVSHQVTVSTFQIDRFEVTYGLWLQVYQYAAANGYKFDHAGSGKATNHPVQMINWYDAVKWCNARSEMEGFTPCYYTDAAQTLIYRTGRVDLGNSNVKWSANGYRLPTEAEWEKAARGGASGYRFPWTSTDNITESMANYLGNNATVRPKYDMGPVGYNSAGLAGGMPYTTPVGLFPANNYGLYDMAGNVEEWCWDWYNSRYYNVAMLSTMLSTDPHGPISSPIGGRVLRGGMWSNSASYCRCMKRDLQRPTTYNSSAGFRCVQSLPNS